MPTVNGKPINQIMQELAADFPANELQTRTDNGQIYLKVEAFRERLDRVLGREHYNEIYKNVSVSNAHDTVGITATGRIEILDDNFNTILVKEASGGSQVIFANNEDGTASRTTNSFGNNVTAACQDAFKKVCRKFGMGVEQVKAKQLGEVYLVQLLYNMDYSKASKGLFTKVKINNNQTVQLAVFKNNLNTFKQYVKQGSPAGTWFYARGNIKENGQYGSQLVFNGFVK